MLLHGLPLRTLRARNASRRVLCCGRWLEPQYGRLIHHSLPNAHHHLAEAMPPDYELQSYWKTRFDTENHFEWLGDGSDTVLPHIRQYLVESCSAARSTPSHPARLLHIGAGTSSLTERIRELYHDVYGADVEEQAIVHADFAENLVARKQAEETARSGTRKGMRWVCMDAMEWNSMKALLDGDGGDQEQGAFDLVVDKSTSDAISCREEISYGSPRAGLHPSFNEFLTASQGRTIDLVPVEVLAIHLASLVRPGGLWVALTFSSNRFPFLSSPRATLDPTSTHAARYWIIEKVVTVDAPTGMEGSGFAPVVQHYVFLLRRTGV